MTRDIENTPNTAGPARSSLGLVFIIVVIDLLGFAIVLPLLPRYAERFDASDLTIGLLFSSFSAMQFLFAPVWGRLSDRIGRRPALLAGLAGSVVFYALFALGTMAESLTWLFVSRIGAGICGATISTAQAYIADATGTRDRAKGMALVGAAFGIGFTFGPILGSIALPGAPPPGQPQPLNPMPGFIASGLSLAALLLAFWKLPESLRPGQSAPAHAWLNLAALQQAVRAPTIGMLLALFFLSTFAVAQLESTLSRLTDAVFGMSDKENFYLFTYLGLSLAIMQGVVVRRLAPRVGEPRMIFMGILLTAVGFEMLSLSSKYESVAGLIVTIPIAMCGFSFVTPSVQALISRRSDPARQGEVMGVAQSVTAMARILGPLVGNLVFGWGGRLVYDMSALLLIPALVLAVLSTNTGRDWSAAEEFDTTPAIEEEPG